ncbi:beta-glucosidase 13-like isoform X2 [Sesamum indicum]|uniref:Beta-glucosidase 13-like isoform X2 n=1 Tax=Sesamum indicum TaxID=4182 RepID=A0A8M8V2J3_SESIN|nr:beta-glucosidase 13-like isoform X2 [Sesamum indicum]
MCEMMSVSKSNNENDQSCVNPLLQSPKKPQSSSSSKFKNPRFFIFFIFVFGSLCTLKIPNFSQNPSCVSQENSSISSEKDGEIGPNSTLSKYLPSRLQNLLCKVTDRMTRKGTYLRMEKDVQNVDTDRIQRQEKGLGLSNDHFNRSEFPPGFLFGAASSAYQYEGAAFEGGKGPSIWDTFTHNFSGKISDGSNGDVAVNFYYLYKDDIKLMKYIGLDAFRMSISWSRILPRGKLSGGVNKEGIDFYNNVLNELIANGITPSVTLFHWDLPQALEDEYTGFLSPLIINDFRDFAELCFKEFGDRVKHWITINEPYAYASDGYDGGFVSMAPGRCSSRAICSQGDSATEPYIAAHHLLLSHAEATKLYKKKYQPIQSGEIGITLNTVWMVPYSSSQLDVKAAQRALDFMYGWFIHPLVYGEYPQIMQLLAGSRLPKFTKEQIDILKGSFDFLGLNYYSGIYAADIPVRSGNISSITDSMVRLSTFTSEYVSADDINGVPIGDTTGSNIPVYPKGLYDLLLYTKKKYKNPTIYITETGFSDLKDGNIEHAIEDLQRINFYNSHFCAVQEAIKKGVKVKGLFAWSFLDTFEWEAGYDVGFGFFYVDFKNGLRRIPKQSVVWFKNFLNKSERGVFS